MPVRTPPPTRACEVCYRPVPLAQVTDRDHPRCAQHADVVRLADVVALPAGAPQLRTCPSCGKQTFRAEGICSRCDPEVPPLRAARLSHNGVGRRRKRRGVAHKPRPRAVRTEAAKDAHWSDNSADRTANDVENVAGPAPLPTFRGRGGRTLRPFRPMDGRIVPALARELATMSIASPDEPINGLRLHPDEPRLLEGPATPWQIGNRTVAGRSVAAQHPARDKALGLMSCPGEWEVLHWYQHPRRVKAAVWYLRRVVAPTLPAGTWRFARCRWEVTAVMGIYLPPTASADEVARIDAYLASDRIALME
jgi:hypothetical protein